MVPGAGDAFIGWNGETYDASHTFTEGGGGKRRSWVQRLSWEPRAYLFHNFLSAAECDHLIELARPHMKDSEVVDNDTGKTKKDSVRTSRGHFLKREMDPTVAAIEARIADWTQLPLEFGEPLHILHYAETQEYQPHYDYFHDTVNVQNGGQRTATVLMYLSDVQEGGETVFPDSALKPSAAEAAAFSACGRRGLAVKPRKGDALLFHSLHPDATPDTHSLHGGCPVLKGNKWSATKWIRVAHHQAY